MSMITGMKVMGINKQQRLLLLFLVSFSLSCSDLTGERSDDAHNIQKVSTNEVGGVNAIELGGDRFLFDGIVDRAGNSRHRFHLRFRLPEGEPVKFFFFSSKTDLSGGLELLWMRTEDGVVMEFSLNGIAHRHRVPTFDDREEIDVDVDVHNDHTDIHILAWDKLGMQGEHEGCTYDGECLYNTEDFAFDVWLGVGRAGGVHWGFQGDRDLLILLEGPLETDSKV